MKGLIIAVIFALALAVNGANLDMPEMMPEPEMAAAPDAEMPNEMPVEAKPTVTAPVKDTCEQMARSFEKNEKPGTLGSFFYDLMCVSDLTDMRGIDFMGRICGLMDVMSMLEQPMSESETYLYNRHCEETGKGKKKLFQRI